MRKQVVRSLDGRIQGSIDYWLNTYEDENYRDRKIKVEEILFPSHSQKMYSDVKVYHISELQK